MLNNNSAELREWASRCEQMAKNAATDDERDSLLQKCQALRALADTEDWLSGDSDQTPATAIPGMSPSDAASA